MILIQVIPLSMPQNHTRFDVYFEDAGSFFWQFLSSDFLSWREGTEAGLIFRCSVNIETEIKFFLESRLKKRKFIAQLILIKSLT